MNADTTNTILTIALETTKMELEQARMQSEDFQSKIAQRMELEEEKKNQLVEEISYIQSQLYRRRGNEIIESCYDAACEALEILDPGDPRNFG